MNKLLQWFREFNTEITWWIIGFLSWSVIDGLARGNYVMAAVNAGLAYLNYRLWKAR